jgi:hypothetical protein
MMRVLVHFVVWPMSEIVCTTTELSATPESMVNWVKSLDWAA